MREKMIELLYNADENAYWDTSNLDFLGKIADRLITNGVTIPVQCDECKHQMGDGACSIMSQGGWDGEFCSHGERITNGQAI